MDMGKKGHQQKWNLKQAMGKKFILISNSVLND